eukprot:TRINITY_DN5406_c0_g1_i8.p1 TRINITY_DN5406_c0_g1~~TRINITY_DN5406_c0_g1_i8.p1  ORF type:complete len:329 (-),score=128.81 TRINITY_DN5406_c0_g1_i8:305-1291(-)
MLDDKQEELTICDGELIATKDRCDELMRELQGLKEVIVTLEEELKNDESEKYTLKAKIESAEEQSKDAHNEIDSLILINEKLTKFNDEKTAKEREYQGELRDLDSKLQSAELECERLKLENVNKDKELDRIDNSRMAMQQKIEELKESCEHYEEELDAREQKIKDMEGQLAELNNHLTLALSKMESNEEYMDSLNGKVGKAEENLIRADGEISRLQKENESLHGLLERYRNDAEMYKKLREEQTLKKYELEQMKSRLEKEAKSKELEARNAKRQLDQVKGSQDKLMNDHYQLNQELEALKEHAEVLETQNDNVRHPLTHSCTKSWICL